MTEKNIGLDIQDLKGKGKEAADTDNTPRFIILENGKKIVVPAEKVGEGEPHEVKLEKGAKFTTICEIRPEMIKDTCLLIGGNPDDPFDMAVTRAFVASDKHSSGLFKAMGKHNLLALYLSYTIDQLTPVKDGDLIQEHEITDINPRGNPYTVAFTDKQNGQITGRGVDVAYMAENPGPEIPGRKPDIETTEPIFTGIKRIITQDQVDKFAKLSGDNNPAHIEPGFLKDSPLAITETISHGMLVLKMVMLEMLKEMKERGYITDLKDIKKLKDDFTSPIRVGVTEFQPELRKINSYVDKKGNTIPDHFEIKLKEIIREVNEEGLEQVKTGKTLQKIELTV